jgi:transcriptional regulator with XRE-family HTH domain
MSDRNEGSTRTRSRRQPRCAAGSLCPKCSLMEVIRFRFGAFREKFGRTPQPDEPLFFDPQQAFPAKADERQTARQIEAGAVAAGVNADVVLRFLGLDSLGIEENGNGNEEQTRRFGAIIRERRRRLDLTQEQVARRIGRSAPYIGLLESGRRHPSQRVIRDLANLMGFQHRELFLLANPQSRGLFTEHPQPDKPSAWEQFANDKQAHQFFKITGPEMTMLSQVALMGEALDPRDFVFILNTVRQALNH